MKKLKNYKIKVHKSENGIRLVVRTLLDLGYKTELDLSPNAIVYKSDWIATTDNMVEGFFGDNLRDFNCHTKISIFELLDLKKPDIQKFEYNKHGAYSLRLQSDVPDYRKDRFVGTVGAETEFSPRLSLPKRYGFYKFDDIKSWSSAIRAFHNTTLLQQLADEYNGNWVPEWNDTMQLKHYVTFDVYNNVFGSKHTCVRSVNQPVFSEESIETVLNILNTQPELWSYDE